MLNEYAPGDWLEIVGGLYEAALDESAWRGMAPRIAGALGASGAVLKVHGTGGGVDLVETTDNMIIAPANQDWAAHWHDNDIWVQRSVAHGLSKVVIGEELLTHDELEASAFYHEWLRHLDIYHMIGAAFSLDNGGVGVLGVHRERRQAGFTEIERGTVSNFLPHLQRALRLRNRVSLTRIDHAIAYNALDELATGVVLLDVHQRVRFANRQAERMFQNNAALRCVAGRLSLSDRILDGRFVQMVRNACGQTRLGAPPAPHALAIARADRMPLTLLVMPLRRGMRGVAGEHLAMLAFCDPETRGSSPELLRELFGLTRTEAAVAAGIAQGLALGLIAKHLRIGIGTVRTHLRGVMAKTGMHSQSALASLIATSATSAIRWEANADGADQARID